ncbi:MAG: CRISPR-associated endonuclease Cas2 [Candidatus Tyrphobacter sp.]
MWIFALFDLPVKTKRERHDATVFRNRLLDFGFSMLQYSVYARPCNRESNDAIVGNIEREMPSKGRVAILLITDKQYSRMRVYRSRDRSRPKIPEQFSLF